MLIGVGIDKVGHAEVQCWASGVASALAGLGVWLESRHEHVSPMTLALYRSSIVFMRSVPRQGWSVRNEVMSPSVPGCLPT